jgi:bisphosphoglycerate-dependent phosphoglycerate mutase
MDNLFIIWKIDLLELDIDLNGRGRSKTQGEKLKDYKFEIAYTSMLIRAEKLANHS